VGSNPLNLALRFLLELAALAATAYWGWQSGAGFLRIVLAVGAPAVEIILWGTFRVPEDPSSSGRAPVPTPGPVRLVLEFAFFGFAAWALWNIGSTALAGLMAVLVLIHYGLSYDRIAWLLQRK
jgi:hypothetical protein